MRLVFTMYVAFLFLEPFSQQMATGFILSSVLFGSINLFIYLCGLGIGWLQPY